VCIQKTFAAHLMHHLYTKRVDLIAVELLSRLKRNRSTNVILVEAISMEVNCAELEDRTVLNLYLDDNAQIRFGRNDFRLGKCHGRISLRSIERPDSAIHNHF